jgi:hypothetical protein
MKQPYAAREEVQGPASGAPGEWCRSVPDCLLKAP